LLEGWWIVQITIRPSFVYDFRCDMTVAAEWASRPLVGSSRKIILGFEINSTPMQSRFFSPPEIPRLSSTPTKES